MELQTRPLTIEEFMQRFSDEGPFEYIDGEFVPMSPQVAGSSDCAGLLYHSIQIVILPRKQGKAFIETTFVLTLDNPDWVRGSRVPDVMYYRAERFEPFAAEHPDWRTRPIPLVPDFAAEVVSPSDKFSDVIDKVQRYLEDGVQLVWVLDPQQKSIIVYRAGSNQSTTYAGEDTVSAADVIPGFELKLSDLYAD